MCPTGSRVFGDFCYRATGKADQAAAVGGCGEGEVVVNDLPTLNIVSREFDMGNVSIT